MTETTAVEQSVRRLLLWSFRCTSRSRFSARLQQDKERPDRWKYEPKWKSVHIFIYDHCHNKTTCTSVEGVHVMSLKALWKIFIQSKNWTLLKSRQGNLNGIWRRSANVWDETFIWWHWGLCVLIFHLLRAALSNIAISDQLQTNLIWFEQRTILPTARRPSNECLCHWNAFELVLREAWVCVFLLLLFVYVCVIWYNPAQAEIFLHLLWITCMFRCWRTAWMVVFFLLKRNELVAIA